MLNKINSMTTNRLTYEAVISIENLEQGLDRLKSGKCPGLDGVLKSDFTNIQLTKLSKDLKKQTYKPKPYKRIQLANPNKSIRTLAIASQIDKVVQAAIINKLEPFVNPFFSDLSFGFRPKLGCHDTLHHIKYNWQNVTWFLTLNFETHFEKTQHKLLLDKLSFLVDQPLLELISKLIKVGYVDIYNINNRENYGNKDIPLGSLISPLLTNIYFHDFDYFLQSNQLKFVRHADDILIGITGNKLEALEILENSKVFLLKNLEITLNMDKSRIQQSTKYNIMYLGMYIKVHMENENSIKLRAPIDKLCARAIDQGFAKAKKDNVARATSCRSMINLELNEIVEKYSSIIKVILNYYSCVNKRSDLWSIVSLYKKSCALTIADKLKLRTAAAVFKKFGPLLKIKNSKNKVIIQLHYPESLKTKIDFKKHKSHIQELVMYQQIQPKISFRGRAVCVVAGARTVLRQG